MFSVNKNLSFMRIISEQKHMETIDITGIFFDIDIRYFSLLQQSNSVASLQQHQNASKVPLATTQMIQQHSTLRAKALRQQLVLGVLGKHALFCTS